MSPPARLLQLEGTRISGVEFLGPLWARNRETLIVRGRESPNVWFYANDPQIAANAVDHVYFSDANSGYAYAFSQPPYGLRCPAECQVNLFRQITASLMPHVLPLSDGAVHIYRWNTDWSPYFEAGREWWGEFLWTVWWPGQKIVVIAASSTD